MCVWVCFWFNGADILYLSFGVTMYPCELPVVDMSENQCFDQRMCTRGIKDHYKSVKLDIVASVGIDCQGRTTTFIWTVFKVTMSSTELTNKT